MQALDSSVSQTIFKGSPGLTCSAKCSPRRLHWSRGSHLSPVTTRVVTLLQALPTDQMEVLAQEAIAGKAKPPGSLGALEKWLAAMQGSLEPRLQDAWLLLFAADHGITKSEPGVSAYPRQVTAAMFGAVARGQAASSVLCAANNVQLMLVDVGVDADMDAFGSQHAAGTSVMLQKVASGTACFTQGPAMTPEQCAAAMDAGSQAVATACSSSSSSIAKHITAPPGAVPGQPAGAGEAGAAAGGLVVCVGELGLGNTTAAAALLAALTRASAEQTCGRGTGVDDRGLLIKQQVVTAALERNRGLVQQGPLTALQAVGGLELAAMTGAYLEAGRRNIPAVVDGFISGVAALAAVRLQPSTRRCLFASHASAEQGAQLLLQELQLQPMLQLGLRLGEGTGAVLAVPLLRSAAAVMRDMASLQQVMDSSASG